MSNKSKVKKDLDRLISSLQDVSDWMYENPELGFEEYKTSEYLIGYLDSHGLEVDLKLLSQQHLGPQDHLSFFV